MATEQSDIVPREPVQISVATARLIAAQLQSKTPREYKKQREGPGGRNLDYVEWGYTARVLDNNFGPLWSFQEVETIEREAVPLPPRGHGSYCKGGCTKKECTEPRPRTEVMTKVRLTLPPPFGQQEAWGYNWYFPGDPNAALADSRKAAMHDALKVCGARYGIGLDLYLRDDADDLAQRQALTEAAQEWQATLRDLRISERAALGKLSEELASDVSALRTLDDVLAALDENEVQAYVLATEKIKELVKAENDATAKPGT